MDSYALLAGDLTMWADSIDADEKYEFAEPNPEDPSLVARIIHLRAGLADIMVKPVGFNPVTRKIMYEAAMHTHTEFAGAVECFRRNREGNERRNREFDINPERAEQRAMGERMGIPREVLDSLLPIDGTGTLDEVRERLNRERLIDHAKRDRPVDNPAPVSGGPTGWEGPTGFYL